MEPTKLDRKTALEFCNNLNWALTFWKFSFHPHGLTGEELKLNPGDIAMCKSVQEHIAAYLCMNQLFTAYEHIFGKATAIQKLLEDKKIKANENWTKYQIVRLIRNSFTHNPYDPKWMIPSQLANKKLRYRDLVFLETRNKDGKSVQREDYGGPIAIYLITKETFDVLMAEFNFKMSPN